MPNRPSNPYRPWWKWLAREFNEPVDIIASGYEWICPKCQSYNSLIAWQPSVTCRNPQCAESFPTNVPEHAID